MDNNTMMILIILAVLVIAFFALRGRGRAGEKPAPAEAPAAPVPAMPAPAAPRAPQPIQVEAGIPPEVVAVIAAAVCAMGGGKYQLRAVRLADRSAWAGAGALDVTRPF